jgi:hypothetical protein
MNVNPLSPINGEPWPAPKELVVTIDGHELARGPITGYRISGGTMGCTNDECIGCIEDEVTVLYFIEPPPKEPGKHEL